MLVNERCFLQILVNVQVTEIDTWNDNTNILYHSTVTFLKLSLIGRENT